MILFLCNNHPIVDENVRSINIQKWKRTIPHAMYTVSIVVLYKDVHTSCICVMCRQTWRQILEYLYLAVRIQIHYVLETKCVCT